MAKIPWNKGTKGLQVAWNKGRTDLPKHTEEHKRKVSFSMKGKNLGNTRGRGNLGKVRSEETRQRLSDSHKGQIAWNTGKKHSPEAIEKMRASHIGWVMPEEAKRKIAEANTGEKNYRWIPDRTVAVERHRRRSSSEWKTWREAVFTRDEYACQECGATGYLEPHHIIPQRVDVSLVFDVENGITLCRPCHVKTRWKEKMFEAKYSGIVRGEVCHG